MAKQNHRVLRNYRNLPPSRFHTFNQRVRKALSDSTRIPEAIWAANRTLIASYFTVSDKHDPVYHEATLGSKLLIAEREVLQAQLVEYLDEIASVLEAAAVRNPDILLVSGFDLAKERRGRTRTTAALAALHAANAAHEGGDAGHEST